MKDDIVSKLTFSQILGFEGKESILDRYRIHYLDEN